MIIEKVIIEQSPEGGRELEIWLEWSMQKDPPVKCGNSEDCQRPLRLRSEAGMAGVE